MSPIRLALVASTAATTTSVVPAGTYKIGLVIAGAGLCHTRMSAAGTAAVVPTSAADVVATNGPQVDNGETITFDGTTKLSAILSDACTGNLVLTRLF